MLVKKTLFILLALVCLEPRISSSLALLLGVFFALLFGNPFSSKTKKWTSQLLAFSVVGLGAGMNLLNVAQVGFRGLGYTVIGILTAMALGTWIGILLKTEKDTSLLVCVGTAICGGSAIAAVAPVIRARDHEVSVALGIVFILNGVALLLFPLLGHYFSLTEAQFGLWSALAIHDTSSVVGATSHYGPQALEIGTTIKLARALWIVPVAFAIGLYRSKIQNTPPKADFAGVPAPTRKPWFILGFILMAALVTFFPKLQPAGHDIEAVVKRLLAVTLFLIGSNLTWLTLKQVGLKPFIQGSILWLLTASLSLFAITRAWIAI